MSQRELEINVRPLSASLDDPAAFDVLVDHMVAATSDLDGLVPWTYLVPYPNLDRGGAAEWLRNADPDLTFFVYANGGAIGVVRFAVPGCTAGFAIPDGVLEREIWLLEEWRGQGIAARAFEQVRPILVAAGYTGVLSLIHIDNERSLANCRRGNPELLGWAPYFERSMDPAAVARTLEAGPFAYYATRL